MPTALPDGSLARHERSVLRWLKRLLLAPAVVLLVLLLATVAVQVYYRLTPTALSEEAKALARELERLPRQTENGYRLAGLLAPEALDPVAYGRCLTEAEVEVAAAWRREVPRGLDPRSDAWKAHYERRDAAAQMRRATCARGQPDLAPSTGTGASKPVIEPGFDWTALVASPPTLAPIAAKRAEQVLADAPARLALPFDVFPLQHQPLLTAHTEALAGFARSWERASPQDRLTLVASLGERHRQWVAFAKGGLIDTGIATAALARQLLVLDAALRRPGVVVDPALLATVDTALEPLDALPAALAEALLIEHRARADLMAFSRDAMVQTPIIGGLSGSPQAWERWLSPVLKATIDPSDTENVSARFTRAMQEAVRSPASSLAFRGDGPVQALPCGDITHDGLFAPCLAVSRNPFERLLLVIGTPAHTDFGLRVHDLRNAAAGLRAALRLRAGAPESDVPRDLYSGRPFERSAEGTRLRVALHAQRSVFGKGQPLEFLTVP